MTAFGLIALIGIIVVLKLTAPKKQQAQTTGFVLIRPCWILLLTLPIGGFGIFLLVQAQVQHIPNLIFGGLILLLPALCFTFAAVRQCIRALEAFFR